MKNKKCENCGVEFGCGSEGPEPCWCTGFDVTEDNLAKIRKEYNDCLCEKCLIEIAKAKAK